MHIANLMAIATGAPKHLMLDKPLTSVLQSNQQYVWAASIPSALECRLIQHLRRHFIVGIAVALQDDDGQEAWQSFCNCQLVADLSCMLACQGTASLENHFKRHLGLHYTVMQA